MNLPETSIKEGGQTSQPAEIPLHELHSLLLLSDSALPLGSFAFSSGLESFLAHQPTGGRTVASFRHFLTLSLASVTSTSLPYVVAAYQTPSNLFELDNDYDASITCTVARRASVKQGRALVTLWERSFRPDLGSSSNGSYSGSEEIGLSAVADADMAAMNDFCNDLKVAKEEPIASANGHLAPLFGTFSALLHVPLEQALYVFLLNHVKALVSAAIRASVLGPYQAQLILAGTALRTTIRDLVASELGHGTVPDAKVKNMRVEEAGQSVPMLDLWGGRHEIVYSRIFNS